MEHTMDGSLAPSAGQHATAALPDALRLGDVHLTVADLERSLGFYERALGLRVLRRDGDTAALGAEDAHDVLVLVERPQAQRAGRHAGLYHVALLYPSRLELARQAQRLAATGTAITGASDHHTHEAIYLSDPDGNGLELAADRPRAQWPDFRSDPYSSRPDPLDLPSLLALADDGAPVAQAGAGLSVGHLHLHVGDVDRAVQFWCGVVGFELQMKIPGAGFVSAGGYHHHLAFNTWRGDGVPAQPPDVVGLHHWTIDLPSEADLDALRARLLSAGAAVADADQGFFVADPWQMRLHVRVRAH